MKRHVTTSSHRFPSKNVHPFTLIFCLPLPRVHAYQHRQDILSSSMPAADRADVSAALSAGENGEINGDHVDNNGGDTAGLPSVGAIGSRGSPPIVSARTQQTPQYSSSSNGLSRLGSSLIPPPQHFDTFSPAGATSLASEFSPAPWVYSYGLTFEEMSRLMPDSGDDGGRFGASGASVPDSAKPLHTEPSAIKHTSTNVSTKKANSSTARFQNADSIDKAHSKTPSNETSSEERGKQMRRTCNFCKLKKVRVKQDSNNMLGELQIA